MVERTGTKRQKGAKYLNRHDDDLEQLQNQLERLPTLGVVLVAGAHEEVLQLPAQCLLFQGTTKPMARWRRGEARVVAAVHKLVALTVLLTAVVDQAVRTGRAFRICSRNIKSLYGA